MLLFKDVKQNYPIYILNKQEFKVVQGKAIKDAGFPYRDTSGKMLNTFGQSSMVVDVSIEAEGKTLPFTIPENLSTAYAGDLVLSPNPEDIVKELESMRAAAKRALSPEETARNKKIVAETDNWLAELSPAHREKAEAEKRMSELESSINDMKSQMQGMYKMFEDFIGEFKK